MNTTCFWLEGESQGKQKGLSTDQVQAVAAIGTAL